MTHESEVAQKMDLDEIRYSRVWEDTRLLQEGLQIGPDDDVLSVTSAGDNVLALLLLEPRSITAIDMSPAQTALMHLKMAGIRRLEHADFVVLIGERTGGDRWGLYQQIRAELPGASRAFWDARRSTIEAGVCLSGRLERYFLQFQQAHLSSAWPRATTIGLMSCETIEEQRALFGQATGPEIEKLIGWFFGRQMLASNGRHPAQFEHVTESDVGGFFYRRFEHACTGIRSRGNHYLEAFLTSLYSDLDAGPEYLRPANYQRLRALMDRVSVVTGELERFVLAAQPGAFSKANLSDVFEYMSPELSERMFALIAERFRAGARIAYWNLLVPRSPPPCLSAKLKSRRHLAQALWREDRAFFYRDFHVNEVVA